eukprot:7307246-Prymnesium_polylepis.1
MLVHLAIFRRPCSVRALDAYFEPHREALWRALSFGGHCDCRIAARHSSAMTRAPATLADT